MKDYGFKLAKERSRSYPIQTITGADYADDIALLRNTPIEAEIQLHITERPAAGICFHVKRRQDGIHMFLIKEVTSPH